MIEKLESPLSLQKITVAILILTGILFRLRQYLTGRSLWVDEAMLALNIVNRSVLDLFKPLDYDQGAPIGFLLIEKIFNLAPGRNEYALRLFPLIAGIAAIVLFYLLLKRTTSGAGLLTALALFVFNPRLIYYSSEVKQYIVDVAVTLGLLLLVLHILEEHPQRGDFIRLALAGFAALWLSHPALFVLAAIGLTLVIHYLSRRDHKSLRHTIGVGIFWLATIAFLYQLILKDLRQNSFMQEYWQGAYFPFPPWSDPAWFGSSITENIGVQFGIPYAVYLVFGLLLIGWVILWKQNKDQALVIGLIFTITLTTSAFHLYPVFERMILFLVPVGLLLLGKTVEALHQSLTKIPVMSYLTTLVFAAFLVYGPLVTSTGYLIKPKYFEHIRPSMEFLQQAWRPGDALYISNGGVPAFEYYAPIYGLSDASYISNDRDVYNNPETILRTLNSLKGNPRVWILISHAYEKGDFNEKDYIFEYLKQNGTRKREFRSPGTSVYLYLFDLGK